MNLREYLNAIEPKVKEVLPQGMNFKRFMADVRAFCADPSKRIDSSVPSALVGAEVMRAASLGLYINGKEAGLAVYKGRNISVQLMPMVAGLMKLARNSGEIASLTTGVIYEKDVFKFWTDDKGEHLEHQPDVFAEDRGERKGAYAMAVLKDGSRMAEVMNKTQIQDVKAAGRGGEKSPWEGAFSDEMWRKSPLRRLFKRLPSSSDLDLAFKADDENFEFETDPEPAPEAPSDTAPTESKGINKLMENEQKKQPPAKKATKKQERNQSNEEPPPHGDDDIPLV